MENDIKRIENFKINDRLIGAPKEKVFSFGDVVLIALIVVMLVFSVAQRVWISPVNIDGNSMNKTIDDGDWLVMNKLARPDYGDVVVIGITGETNYIKRVIGLPGDTICINDDVVYRKKERRNGIYAARRTVRLLFDGEKTRKIRGDDSSRR